MSRVHEQYQPFLEQVRGRPPMHATPLTQLRAGRSFTSDNHRDLARVENLMVQTCGVAIPVRLYRNFDGDLPLVIFLHGGGFVMGGLDGYYDPLCRRIAAECGCAVIAVDYRLAPESRYPAAADDAYAVLAWAAANAPALAIDASRIALFGPSAGGNLAAVTAQRARDQGGPPVAGQVLFYPVVDHYSHVTPSYETFAEGYHLTREDMIWFWDQYLPADAPVPAGAAPLRAGSFAGLPATLVVTAECDPLRDEAEHYVKRLADEGVDTELLRVEGAMHGFLSVATERTEFAVSRALDWLGALWASPRL